MLLQQQQDPSTSTRSKLIENLKRISLVIEELKKFYNLQTPISLFGLPVTTISGFDVSFKKNLTALTTAWREVVFTEYYSGLGLYHPLLKYQIQRKNLFCIWAQMKSFTYSMGLIQTLPEA